MVSIGSPTLISLYCTCIVFFCFPLFTYFFVESATCSEIEVSLINYKKEVELLLDSKCMGGFLQPYLVISITGLTEFGKNLSYALSSLAPSNYFLKSISVKLIYQFLSFINDYFSSRSLEKVFEEERNGN